MKVVVGLIWTHHSSILHLFRFEIHFSSSFLSLLKASLSSSVSQNLVEAQIQVGCTGEGGKSWGVEGRGGWAVGAIVGPRATDRSQAKRKHFEDLYGGKEVQAGGL